MLNYTLIFFKVRTIPGSVNFASISASSKSSNLREYSTYGLFLFEASESECFYVYSIIRDFKTGLLNFGFETIQPLVPVRFSN